MKLLKGMKMKRWIRRLKCKLVGHDFDVVDVSCTGVSAKLGCKRCGDYYGINHNVRAVIRWDHELEECFTLLNNRHSKYWPKQRQWLK